MQPHVTELGGSDYRLTFPSGATFDVTDDRESSWPGVGPGDPPGWPCALLYEQALAELDARHVKPGSAVLDAGCSCGYGLLLIGERYAPLGLERDYRRAVVGRELLAANNSRAELRVGEIEAAQYSDLAAVVAIESLEHVPRWYDALRRLWHCLRPGGVLVLSTPVRGFDSPTPFHVEELSEDELKAALATAGFVDVHHWSGAIQVTKHVQRLLCEGKQFASGVRP